MDILNAVVGAHQPESAPLEGLGYVVILGTLGFLFVRAWFRG